MKVATRYIIEVNSRELQLIVAGLGEMYGDANSSDLYELLEGVTEQHGLGKLDLHGKPLED